MYVGDEARRAEALAEAGDESLIGELLPATPLQRQARAGKGNADTTGG